MIKTRQRQPWIGVDLDGTLAYYDEWRGVDYIGRPIPLMVARVKQWLDDGQDVRVFTARFAEHGQRVNAQGTEVIDAITPIQKWCLEHIGQVLPVTNVKDFDLIELWDDRAVRVEHNTGFRIK